MWLAVVLASLVAGVSAFECPYWRDSKFVTENCCEGKYSNLGCFSRPNGNTLNLPCCYDDHDITYALYTRNNKKDLARVYLNDIPSQFDGSKRTVFISHGYMSSGSNVEFLRMKDAFLDREDMNVIVITWPSTPLGNPQQSFYPNAAGDTQSVGKLNSLLMKTLVEEKGASYDNMWCVGHSLGSHVCAFTGRATGGKLGQITGLDPAGPSFDRIVSRWPPYFLEKNLALGLRADDAKFVANIHTDSSDDPDLSLPSVSFTWPAFGTGRAHGDVDFFVNGREEQPGCMSKRRKRHLLARSKRGIDFAEMLTSFESTGVSEDGDPPYLSDNVPMCSHMRAPDYFTEAVKADCFVAQSKCTDVNDFDGSCTPCGDDCPVMGYSTPDTAKGIYYVKTSGKVPYCLGPK